MGENKRALAYLYKHVTLISFKQISDLTWCSSWKNSSCSLYPLQPSWLQWLCCYHTGGHRIRSKWVSGVLVRPHRRGSTWNHRPTHPKVRSIAHLRRSVFDHSLFFRSSSIRSSNPRIQFRHPYRYICIDLVPYSHSSDLSSIVSIIDLASVCHFTHVLLSIHSGLLRLAIDTDVSGIHASVPLLLSDVISSLLPHDHFDQPHHQLGTISNGSSFHSTVSVRGEDRFCFQRAACLTDEKIICTYVHPVLFFSFERNKARLVCLSSIGLCMSNGRKQDQSKD